MAQKYQRESSEAQAALYEEGVRATRLQMELDSKESEVELLIGNMALQNSDTASVNSGSNDLDDDSFMGGEETVKPGVLSHQSASQKNPMPALLM